MEICIYSFVTRYKQPGWQSYTQRHTRERSGRNCSDQKQGTQPQKDLDSMTVAQVQNQKPLCVP